MKTDLLQLPTIPESLTLRMSWLSLCSQSHLSPPQVLHLALKPLLLLLPARPAPAAAPQPCQRKPAAAASDIQDGWAPQGSAQPLVAAEPDPSRQQQQPLQYP
jgi:hypothetical protein